VAFLILVSRFRQLDILCEVGLHLSAVEFVVLDKQLRSSCVLWLGEYYADALEALEEIEANIGVDLLEQVGEVGLIFSTLVDLLRHILDYYRGGQLALVADGVLLLLLFAYHSA